MNSKTTALIVLLAISSGMFLITSDATDASASEDNFTFYTYSPTFHSTAEHAEDVRWDFGDGTILDSRESGQDYIDLLIAHGEDVWNPRHTYAETGDYTVTMIVYNSSGEPSDPMSYTIHIMGHPIVTFKNGNTTWTATVPFIGENPQTLSDDQIPKIDDDAFEGWYYDSGYTDKWNPDDPIDGHKTLYAKISQPSDNLMSTYFPIILLVILVVLALGIWAAKKGKG